MLFRRLRERAQASKKLFSSPRMQEAIKEEWLKGGCYRQAVFGWLFFAAYCLVYSLLAVYSTGQNAPDGYNLVNGVNQIIFQQSLRHDDSPNPVFMNMQDVNDFWLWNSRCLVGALTNGSSTTWYEGERVENAGAHLYVNNMATVLGRVRYSQWRTSTAQCPLPSVAERAFSSCFPDYCPVWTWDPLTWQPCWPTEDRTAFGPDNKYTFRKNVHRRGFTGKLGVYGTGSFTVVLPQQGDAGNYINNLADDIATLQNDNWVDAGTRAVAIEFSLYSAAINKFTTVIAFVEFPPYGNYPVPNFDIFTFTGYSYIIYGNEYFPMPDKVLGAIIIVWVVFVFAHIFVKLHEWRQMQPYFFLNGFNLIDISLMIVQLTTLGLKVTFTTTLYHITAHFLDSAAYEGEYLDMRLISLLRQYESLLLSIGVILAWCKFLEPSQLLAADFYVLVKLIVILVGKLLQSFLPMLAIVYLAWVFSRYVLTATDDPNFITIATAVGKQYGDIMGNFDLTPIPNSNRFPMWQLLQMIVLILIIFLIMLNLFISIINDLYVSIKVQAKADWCKQQAIQIIILNRTTLSSPSKPWSGGGVQVFKAVLKAIRCRSIWSWFREATRGLCRIFCLHRSASEKLSPQRYVAPEEIEAISRKHPRDGYQHGYQSLERFPSGTVHDDQKRLEAAYSNTNTNTNDYSDKSIRSSTRLLRIRDRAADINRLFFAGDSVAAMKGTLPLLEQLNIWVTLSNKKTPPLHLLEILAQDISDVKSFNTVAALRQLLGYGALRIVASVMEEIMAAFPRAGSEFVDSPWTHAMRTCIRCAFKLTVRGSSAAASDQVAFARVTDDSGGRSSFFSLRMTQSLRANAISSAVLDLSKTDDLQKQRGSWSRNYQSQSQSLSSNISSNSPTKLQTAAVGRSSISNDISWAGDVMRLWGGEELLIVVGKIFRSLRSTGLGSLPSSLSMSSSMSINSTGWNTRKNRLILQGVQYDIDLLRLTANILQYKQLVVKYETSSAQRFPVFVDGVMFAALVGFASCEETDDLHQELASSAASIIKRYCLQELLDELVLNLKSTKNLLRMYKLVMVCKRISMIEGLGAKAITTMLPVSHSIADPQDGSGDTSLPSTCILLQLASVLSRLAAIPSRSRTEIMISLRVAQTIKLTVQQCVIKAQDVEDSGQEESDGNRVESLHRFVDSMCLDGLCGEDTETAVLKRVTISNLVPLLMKALSCEVLCEMEHAGTADLMSYSYRATGLRQAFEDHSDEDVATTIIETLYHLLYIGNDAAVAVQDKYEASSANVNFVKQVRNFDRKISFHIDVYLM